MGCFATPEYIRRVVQVMQACAEEQDSVFQQRGERLYCVLRDVYAYTQRDNPGLLETLFPEEVTVLSERHGASYVVA